MTSPRLTAGVCPPREVLVAWTRGALPAEHLEAVAEHVCSCPRCEPVLGDLDEAGRLLACLREAPTEPFLLEAGCARLEERARAVRTVRRSEPTRSDHAETVARELEEAGERPRPTFGNYLLLERLGRGGMGVVYKAMQEPVHRLVALKMIRAGEHADEEELARFRTEGEAVARLRHANVIQLYDFGEHDGQPYFSMEYAAGGSLAAKLAGGALPARQAAELVRTLALAVEAAHRERIVHRDLKPANVLLMADGTPKVSDFGLAKLLDTDSVQTRSDAVLGTPAYMAPEQAAGRVRDLGPAVDVWALGVILFECLTGKTPFRGMNKEETLERVCHREPERLSRLRPGLSRDLEAICLKCLEKTPGRRFGTAQALAEDLGRWLEGRPTQARPLGRLGRGWHSVRRHPVRMAVVVLVLLGAGLLPALLWYRDPLRPLREIEARLARGESITLIPEAGAPAWSELVAGRSTSQASAPQDGLFTVHATNQVALLDLVRDPGRDRYRFRARIHHATGQEQCEVGIYFARRAHATSGGTVHCFGALLFNDVKDDRDLYQRLLPKLPKPPPPPPRGNRAILKSHLHAEGEEPWTFGGGKCEAVFEPARTRDVWRELAVEVTPSGVRGFWQGQPIGKLSAQAFFEAPRNYLDLLRHRGEDSLFVKGLAPEYAPRGALGVYVFRGSVSIHRVAIEPLDE